MAYAEWHGSIINHHKTVELMKLAGVNKREAVGIRGCLIGWTIDNRPGGYVERKLLAFACAWDADANKIEKYLITTGLVDEIDDQTVYIHDWPEYTKGFKKARKDARRKRLQRKRASEKSVDSPRTVQGLSTERRGEQTRPEQSGTDQTRTDQNGAEGVRGSPPEAPKPAAPPPPPVLPDGAAVALGGLIDLWNHGRAAKTWIKPTPARLAKVRARLKEGFTVEQLRAAIANIRESEFHNGGNDRGWKVPGPEWVFHTRERTESWVHWERPKSGEEKLREWARGVDGGKGVANA